MLGVIDLCAFPLGLDDHEYFHSLPQFAVLASIISHTMKYIIMGEVGTTGLPLWTGIGSIGHLTMSMQQA